MKLIKMENLGSIVTLFFFSIGVFVIFASLYFGLNKTHIGLAFAIPSIVYLVFIQRTNRIKTYSTEIDKRFFVILSALFFIVVSLSLLSWHSETYSRPLSFFILVAASYMIIAGQIIFFGNRKYTPFILLEIFIISVILRASVYFEFPTVYGNDPFFHIQGVQTITAQGFLSPELDLYVNFPYAHILTTSIGEITSLSVKNAYFVISIIEILVSLFVFLIVRKFGGTKLGLLSAMIITLAPYNILWGFLIIPMTLGLVFFVIILYLFIKKYFLVRENRINTVKISFLLIFLCLSSILVHTIAPFVTWVTLVLILVGLILTKFFTPIKQNVKTYLFFNIIILYGVALFSYWMSIQRYSGDNLFSLFTNSLMTFLTKMDLGSVASITLAPTYSYLSILLVDLPFILLLSFGIFGTLFIMNHFYQKAFSNHQNNDTELNDIKPLERHIKIKLAIIFSTFFLVGLVYTAGIFGIQAILPSRWFAFIEVLLIIPAVYGIYLIIFSKKNPKIQFLIASIIIFIFAFSAITTPLNNGDNPLYAEELSVRSALFDSEAIAADFLTSNYDGTVSRNSKYQFIEGNNLNPNEQESFNESMVVLRNFDIEKGFYIPLFGAEGEFLSIISPDEEFSKSLEISNKLYENGEVRMYYKFENFGDRGEVQ